MENKNRQKAKTNKNNYSLITQNNCFQIIMSKRFELNKCTVCTAHTMQTQLNEEKKKKL